MQKPRLPQEAGPICTVRRGAGSRGGAEQRRREGGMSWANVASARRVVGSFFCAVSLCGKWSRGGGRAEFASTARREGARREPSGRRNVGRGRRHLRTPPARPVSGRGAGWLVGWWAGGLVGWRAGGLAGWRASLPVVLFAGEVVGGRRGGMAPALPRAPAAIGYRTQIRAAGRGRRAAAGLTLTHTPTPTQHPHPTATPPRRTPRIQRTHPRSIYPPCCNQGLPGGGGTA